jgi:hypothetical protein
MKVSENATAAIEMAIRHSYQYIDIKGSDIATATIAISIRESLHRYRCVNAESIGSVRGHEPSIDQHKVIGEDERQAVWPPADKFIEHAVCWHKCRLKFLSSAGRIRLYVGAAHSSCEERSISCWIYKNSKRANGTHRTADAVAIEIEGRLERTGA